MNNISDKLVLTIILITILFVFGLIFSVKSPERKVIDSPIMWKDDYSKIAIISNKINSENKRMEIKFSCGENGISEYLDDGWTILEENSEEKICTWKSFPASKDCNMEKDKGCKITKPDKIGEEKIY